MCLDWTEVLSRLVWKKAWKVCTNEFWLYVCLWCMFVYMIVVCRLESGMQWGLSEYIRFVGSLDRGQKWGMIVYIRFMGVLRVVWNEACICISDLWELLKEVRSEAWLCISDLWVSWELSEIRHVGVHQICGRFWQRSKVRHHCKYEICGVQIGLGGRERSEKWPHRW